MEVQHLQDLYIQQLRDLYSAEDQLCEALPKMAEAASNDALRAGFEEHLQQTRRQREDVGRLIEALGEDPEGHECKGMKGLIEEGEELIEEGDEADPDVLDAGLIAAAQRVEHYEMAGYGTVCAYAETLGRHDDVRVLKNILDEESKADKKLTQIAERIVNPAAMNGKNVRQQGGRRSARSA